MEDNIVINTKRRAVNVTVRHDVLKAAKALNLNTSQAAEKGIIQAVKEAQAQAWLEKNKKALSAHNKRIEENGVLLKPDWTDE